MPDYNAVDFDPPAPVALVELRHPVTGETLSNIRMLMDTGADVTLVPQDALDRLRVAPTGDAAYELAGFGGEQRVLAAVHLDLIFGRKTFRGQFLPIDRAWGILGRNVLNAVPLLLNGPKLIWEEYKGDA